MITSQTQIRVRYVETDCMGIVYHANYLTWFEIGRIQLLDDMGVPYTSLEKNGFLLPVLAVNCQFLSPAFFDDRLTISTTIPEPARIKIGIQYQVHRGEELLCTGHTSHAFMGRDNKAVRPPPIFKDKLDSYFGPQH